MPLFASAMLLALTAYGAEPGVPTHPLVASAEMLYQHLLAQGCDDLLKLASMAPGLTNDDLARLQLVTAMRALDEGHELSARRALSEALRIDRSVPPPWFASNQLKTMLEEARAQLPPEQSPVDETSQLEAARRAAARREPAPRALLRAVDALAGDLQIEGASLVLSQAVVATPLTEPDRARLALRRGLLAMESADESGARAAFQEALQADPSAQLPDYAPPKTRHFFEEVQLATRATFKAPARPPAEATLTRPVPDEPPVEKPSTWGTSRTWGGVVGGVGLASAAGGVVAGVIALSAYQAEQRASADGDFAAYTANRDATSTAMTVSSSLYAVGAVGLGVGAFLFFRAPGETTFGAGVGKGNASLVLSGHF